MDRLHHLDLGIQRQPVPRLDLHRCCPLLHHFVHIAQGRVASGPSSMRRGHVTRCSECRLPAVQCPDMSLRQSGAQTRAHGPPRTSYVYGNRRTRAARPCPWRQAPPCHRLPAAASGSPFRCPLAHRSHPGDPAFQAEHSRIVDNAEIPHLLSGFDMASLRSDGHQPGDILDKEVQMSLRLRCWEGHKMKQTVQQTYDTNNEG